MINDIQLILTVIPKDSAISIEKDMSKNYSLIGYFARYGNVSLNKNEKLNYHISFQENNVDKENYKQININSKLALIVKLLLYSQSLLL